MGWGGGGGGGSIMYFILYPPQEPPLQARSTSKPRIRIWSILFWDSKTCFSGVVINWAKIPLYQ